LLRRLRRSYSGEVDIYPIGNSRGLGTYMRFAAALAISLTVSLKNTGERRRD
jgi:hypothetical protein